MELSLIIKTRKMDAQKKKIIGNNPCEFCAFSVGRFSCINRKLCRWNTEDKLFYVDSYKETKN